MNDELPRPSVDKTRIELDRREGGEFHDISAIGPCSDYNRYRFIRAASGEALMGRLLTGAIELAIFQSTIILVLLTWIAYKSWKNA